MNVYKDSVMKYLILGTSKTNPIEEGYYIEEDQQAKVWGNAFRAAVRNEDGNQVRPTEYKQLEKNYGVFIDDIVDSQLNTGATQDNQITKEDLEDGLPKIDKKIVDFKPEVIVFNGIKAPKLLYNFKKNKRIAKSPKVEIEIGKQNWGFYTHSNVYVLPSTASNAEWLWDDFDGNGKWFEFWRSVAEGGNFLDID